MARSATIEFAKQQTISLTQAELYHNLLQAAVLSINHLQLELIPSLKVNEINEQDDEKRDDREIDDLIDRGLETRFFQSDPNSFLNSRVGMAERIGQEQELGTIIKGFDKLAKKEHLKGVRIVNC